MITFSNPFGLAALASLVVALAIHLMRRSDERRVSFAALRFLRDRPHPRSRWQLREPALLAIRLLLLAALSVLLAAPGWRSADSRRAAWTLVMPGVGIDIDHELKVGEWHWLAPGFPALNADAEPGALAPASLVREADAALPQGTTITVIVPHEMGGLDAERLRLAHTVAWRAVAGALPAPPRQPIVPSGIAIRYNAAGASQLPIARALAAAWGTALHTSEGPLDLPPDSGNWLIWLGGPLTPEVIQWVHRGGRALSSAPTRGETVLTDAAGAPVFSKSRLGDGILLGAAAPLTVQKLPALLDPAIAQRLLALLQAPLDPPNRAMAGDVAPLPGAVSARATAILPLSPYFAFAAVVLFLGERLVATRRGRLRPSEARD